jgi:acetylornithine deacetylase/succinyl-diaminopimelate desuccinylase-like protein
MQLCANHLLRPNGLEPRLLPSRSEGASQVNLICLVRGQEHDRPPIILNTHLDTVPPGDPTSWTECPEGPFVPVFKDQRIYGLGAADTKLDFAAKTLALIECGLPRRDVFLVATFGEEHGLVGAKELAGAGILPKGGLAFVGEPSHLQVITAHKGLIVFELEIQFSRYRERQQRLPIYRLIFRGQSVHSSTPALGRNAIRLALDFVNQSPDLRIASIEGGDAVNKVPGRCTVAIGGAPPPIVENVAQLEGGQGGVAEFIPSRGFSLLASFLAMLAEFADRAGKPESDYAAPTLTFNPGVIQSKDDSILLEFELRPPPSLPLEEIRKGVTQICETVSRLYTDLKIKITEQRANPGFRSSAASETVELAMAALAGAGLSLQTGVKTGCTEAGVYADVGISPVVLGPGPSTGVIHAPNEYNLVADVEGAVKFYRELLRL